MSFAYYSKLMEKECQRMGHRTTRLSTVAFRAGKTEFYKTTASPSSARQICKDKQKTKDYVSAAGLLVPNGYVLTKDEPIELRIPYPVVVKPVDSSLGRDVVVNINDYDTFLAAVNQVFSWKNRVLIEEHIEGEKYRVFSTDKKIISVIEYTPASVTGDGVNTISKLAAMKSAARASKYPKLPQSMKPPAIKISDNKLASYGYTIDSILPEGVTVETYDYTAWATGAESKEIVNESNGTFDFCSEAVASVPKLISTGVDVIIEEGTGRKFVLEMNGCPHIRNSMSVTQGTPVHIVRELVGAYLSP